MKQISKKSAARMCAALEYALDMVRDGTCLGLCGGIEDAHISAGILFRYERIYLIQGIHKMLRPAAWLENYMSVKGRKRYNPELRYERRKPWVEWMIQHLKETT